jgi:cell wall-associated NlpC family hydrolase
MVRADWCRRTGRTAKAAAEDKAALRHGHVAFKNHSRAQFWLGRVKVLTQRVHGLETTQAQLVAQLKALDHVAIKGDSVTGGTAHERLKVAALAAAANCASGHRPNFYSQSGAWDVSRCISGEHYGERSDCSSWVTSAYKSAGLSDPNGTGFTGGFTGTLYEHGHAVNQANLKPGDLIIYGAAPGHHVELYVGPGDKTIGHGSAPVDAGVCDLFGDGDWHPRRYVP